MSKDFHGLGPERIDKPQLGQVDIGVAITLGIGIGGDAFEIEIVEFDVDFKSRTERFSFVGWVEVGVERKRYTYCPACPSPWPSCSRTIFRYRAKR